MTDTKATKPATTNASEPAGGPVDAIGVFTKDTYTELGCYKTGQHIKKSRAGRRWDEWLAARILRVL